MKFCWCALVLLTLVPVVTGNNVGVKAKITKTGLDFGLTVAVSAIKKILKTMTFPDIPIPSYKMRRVKIQSLDKLDAVQKTDSTGFTITVKSANIRITGTRKSDGRNPFELTLKTLDISATVVIKTDETGHLTLRLKKCKAKMGAFGVNPKSWLIKFLSLFQRWTGIAQTKICHLMKTTIADYNNQLETLNAKLNEYAKTDFSMGPVGTSSDGIEFSVKDIFFNLGQPKETPPSSTDFTLPSQNTKMFYLGISASTIKSLAAAFHKTGFLSIWIFDDMVPSWILTTTTFGAYIPEISEKYPDRSMVLGIETPKEPVIKFEANKLVLDIFYTLTATVIQSDTETTQLFVLNLEASIDTQLYTTEQKLSLALTLNKIEVSIKKNILKKFEVTKLNSLLDMVMKWVVFPAINAHLAKGYLIPGFSLPSDFGKIDFVNTQVECISCANTQGHLFFGTDFKLEENPSPEYI